MGDVCLQNLSSILIGDTMVSIIEYDYILLLGSSILFKEYNLTRFNHQEKHYSDLGSSLACRTSAGKSSSSVNNEKGGSMKFARIKVSQLATGRTEGMKSYSSPYIMV